MVFGGEFSNNPAKNNKKAKSDGAEFLHAAAISNETRSVFRKGIDAVDKGLVRSSQLGIDRQIVFLQHIHLQ